MKLSIGFAAMLMSAFCFAGAQHVKVPSGTPVTLIFDQALSSRTAHAGDTVKMHIGDNVYVDGHLVLKRGTHVSALLSRVDKNKRYGVNATMQLAINPVHTIYGQEVRLQPRQKGKAVGHKTGLAAGLSGIGAVILGPIGLAGGYFVVGKAVNIKEGDKLETQVAKPNYGGKG